MSSIKETLRPLAHKVYGVRDSISQSRQYKRNHGTKYRVEGEIRNLPKMLFVLSGYKKELWDDVFTRIKRNQPSDMEICIGSSGKYCQELSDLCKKNGWVYISTTLNNVCVATNVIIREFPKAEYIYKLDEDIYVPDGYFDDMYEAYKRIEERENAYKIGYICPLLPLGFYGMHQFLEDNNCLDEYEKKFGKHFIGGTEMNPNFRHTNKGLDEFIWSKIGNFDECVEKYKNKPFSYEPCVTRSGIATILFKREFWDRLGSLTRHKGIGVGSDGDEGQITAFCALNFRACFCVKNILVGHFSFGGAEKNVLKYREEHPEVFKMKE